MNSDRMELPDPAAHAAMVKQMGYTPSDWLNGYGVVLRDHLPSEWAKEVFDALVALYPLPSQD